MATFRPIWSHWPWRSPLRRLSKMIFTKFFGGIEAKWVHITVQRTSRVKIFHLKVKFPWQIFYHFLLILGDLIIVYRHRERQIRACSFISNWFGDELYCSFSKIEYFCTIQKECSNCNGSLQLTNPKIIKLS